MTNIYMEIGSRVRIARINAGLTQDGLSEMVNVTPQTVSRWECGKSIRMPIEKLYRLATELRVSIYALLPENKL